MPVSAFGTAASEMTGSAGGFPPTNDIVNAGINAGGLAALLGFGELASILKGIFQQTFSGTQSNTNPLSLVESAAYGPGLGERAVDWASSLFGGNADPNPANAQSLTSAAQTGGTHAPTDFLSRNVSGLEQAVANLFGGKPAPVAAASGNVADNVAGPIASPIAANSAPGVAGNTSGPRPYYGTPGPSSVQSTGALQSGLTNTSEAGRTVASALTDGASITTGNPFGPSGDFGSLGFSVSGGSYGGLSSSGSLAQKSKSG